ncbi:metallophosphoesterase [Robiginitalea sediminis]|uniref:metallophosphoesterase n=1 Tax=Robiginitalea sediminis TaxID=1982593 RepID=UPI000B4C03AD|nr:metallophosphoesterase [Robiginitalea sediminis]
MRTIVIGDIHGGLKALKLLLDEVGPEPGDRLVFLGDYVDGWSEAAGTVAFLMELERQHDCVFLRGNHDDLCLDWLRDGKAPDLWLHSGGVATQLSYKGLGGKTREAHIRFLEQTRDYLLDEDRRLYLHAGFTNQRGVEHEYFSKNFYWDRTLWETALALNPELTEDQPTYPRRLRVYREIFIGHTPVTRIGKTAPYRAANVWNIDTGAAFRGPLSAMDVTEGQVWQSPPVHELYPGEQGRN